MDTDSLNFMPYNGDIGNLPCNDNHLIFKWTGKGKVLFSVAQKGKAVSAHFSSDKEGLREVKEAINEFCDFVFWLFEWCEMIFAQIERPSVERIVKKCGFSYLATDEDIKVYMRSRSWAQLAMQ